MIACRIKSVQANPMWSRQEEILIQNPLDLHPIQVMEFLTAQDFKIFLILELNLYSQQAVSLRREAGRHKTTCAPLGAGEAKYIMSYIMKMCGILPPVAKRLKFAGHYGALHINREFNSNKKDILINIFWGPWQVCASGSTRCSKPAWIHQAWRGPGSACRIRSRLHLSFLWGRCCSYFWSYRCCRTFSQTFDSLTLLSIQRTDHATKNISTNLFESTQNVTRDVIGFLAYIPVGQRIVGQ